MYEEDVEKHAEDFLKRHYSKALLQPIDEIVKEMKMEFYYAPLEDGIFSVLFYLDTEHLAYGCAVDVAAFGKDFSAQIDYIVITRKTVYVIECKNLVGNIEIDNTGAFIRSYEVAGKWIKEGIYSPITQNRRHLQVLKAVRKNAKKEVKDQVLRADQLVAYIQETDKASANTEKQRGLTESIWIRQGKSRKIRR